MMASKGHNFIDRLRVGPVDLDLLGGREPANQSDPREAGARRGAAYPGRPSLPGDSDMEVDLLGDDGGRQRSGWRSGVATVAALSVAAGVLWYGYNWGIEQLATTRLPYVAVLNDAAPRPGSPQAERLLPPPEAPQMAQTEAPQGMSVAEVENILGPPLESAAGTLEGVVTAEQAEPPAVPQIAAESPLEAVAVTALPQPEPEPEPEPEPQAVAPAAPELPAVPPVTPSAATPSAAVSEPAPQIAALPEAQTGDYVVQLAALKAKDSARPAWARMQQAHPALLGDRELAIQQVDLGDRGIFYRVQAGFFAERAGANELCTALKARGQDCFVVKR